MRRAGPYRGENSGPARMIAESLTPKPGIREHIRAKGEQRVVEDLDVLL
jgi:hypothetical protein